MNMNKCVSLGAVSALAFAGCISGMYSSNVSVDNRAGGVTDYTVVQSLDVVELPESMPVVVESTSSTKKMTSTAMTGWWLLTLGIVPGVDSGETIGTVTVKTPIGEKSGTYKLEAKKWYGWLPMFLPYPGVADVRLHDPTLPNKFQEGTVHDKLVKNLVSQFSKEEYAGYVAKNSSPEMKAMRKKEKAERERIEKERAEAERARIAKEAAERAEKEYLAKRTALYEIMVTNYLAEIKKCYSQGEGYLNPFLGDTWWRRSQTNDWLSKWASPRLSLTESDKLAGEALLSAFGTKYLPNAYASYEKKRDALAELQQVFNEEFPRPWTIKATSPKWNSFNKILERFVKVRTDFFISHDELCHFWLMHRFGVLTEKDFATIDTKPLAVHLLPENIERVGYARMKIEPMDSKVFDFALKYAPESNAIYQKMEREFKEHDALLSEVFKQHIQIDDVRFSRVLAAAVDKHNDLARNLNALALQLQSWQIDHRTMEKTSEDVAKCDVAMSKQLKPFVEALPGYMKERSIGPVIANSDLVSIPEKNYRMQRTEMTQMQWMIVMGNNPSGHKGLNLPVENVSWSDCQEFIKRVIEMDGRQYRLPTEKEWQYACLAGSGTEWGKRANGECGPLEVMGWFCDNSGGKTHPVGFKEPNVWGLFDMHGNVYEWCQDRRWSDNPQRVYCGGNIRLVEKACSASHRVETHPDNREDFGFRVVITCD